MNFVVTARGRLSVLQFFLTVSLNYTFLISEKCKIGMRRDMRFLGVGSYRYYLAVSTCV